MAIKLLIVDDERDVELLFKQRLRKSIREGHVELQFVFSGEEALAYMEACHQPDIALILSDINMPGMSGFELLKKVKERYPSLKVMMITAYGDDAHAQQARALGAWDFLSKPIDFTDLEQRLQQFLP